MKQPAEAESTPRNVHPPLVLFGSDCLTGLQTARILWRKKVPVLGVANDPGSAYCRTRAVIRTVPASEIQDDAQPLLKMLHAQYGVRPVALACTDEFVWWMNDHREAIGEYADFLLPPSSALRLLADKASFYRHAMAHGLPVPETRFVTHTKELEAAGREMTFPLVLKPARRSPEWMEASGGFKVRRVENAAELRHTGPALCAAAGELILQTWVRGPDANMHSLYVWLDRQSHPLIASIVAKKIRQWPPDVGVGSLAVETQVDEVVRTGLGILQELGYAGPGSLQFKQDEVSGKFYVIEMNTRTPLNFPLCEACGVEATYTGYCAAAGLPLPANRTVTRPGSKWICWKTDLPSAYAHWKRGDLTVREWMASLRGPKWSADLQFDDLMPLLADLGAKIFGGRSPRWRNILREP